MACGVVIRPPLAIDGAKIRPRRAWQPAKSQDAPFRGSGVTRAGAGLMLSKRSRLKQARLTLKLSAAAHPLLVVCSSLRVTASYSLLRTATHSYAHNIQRPDWLLCVNNMSIIRWLTAHSPAKLTAVRNPIDNWLVHDAGHGLGA